jgi:hypothetical protein
MPCASRYYTTAEVARQYGCHEWQVARLFRRGILDEVPRVGQVRVIPADLLPAIRGALVAVGYLEETADA